MCCKSSSACSYNNYGQKFLYLTRSLFVKLAGYARSRIDPRLSLLKLIEIERAFSWMIARLFSCRLD